MYVYMHIHRNRYSLHIIEYQSIRCKLMEPTCWYFLIHFNFVGEHNFADFIMKEGSFCVCKLYIQIHTHTYLNLSLSYVTSVVSNSLRPYGPQPARLLYPWNAPGKNTDTGVGCQALLQGIFLTQESNPCLLGLLHQQAGSLVPPGKPLPPTHIYAYALCQVAKSCSVL